MPWASTTAWCLLPFFPRSVGFGPVSSPPPSARAKELSTAARDQSILSAPCNSSSNRTCSCTQTPASCHSASRRRQRLPEPQFSSRGRSFQLMPVLRTKRIPVRAWRCVSGLRPGKRKRRGLGGGSSGSMRCQSSSVSRGLAIAQPSGAKSRGGRVPKPCRGCVIPPPFLKEKLRDRTLGEPAAAISGHSDYFGRLAFDGNLTWPRQRWTTIFPCIGKWSTIGSHLIVAQPAQYRSGQEVFNEHVLLKHHCLAILAAKPLEDGSLIFRPILPGNGLNKRLHVGDTLDPLGVLARPIEA